MQISVESTSELSRKMTIQVSEGTIQEKIDSRLKSMTHQVRMDGFRPGKVPQSVMRKRFGSKVREEVLSEMIQSSFQEALRDERLKPAGVPQIVAHKADEGEGLEYEAHFEILPDFVPMPFEALEVSRFVSTLSEDDVDIMIRRLQHDRTTWHRVDRPAAMGDRIIMSFEGWDGEESFTNGRVENFSLVLGSRQMIPGFEEALIGAQGGSTLNFSVDFPEDYPGAKMAGKTGRFAIDVSSVEEGVVPELNAEFAKSFGIDDGDMQAFRDEVRSNMQRELRQALEVRTKASVLDQLYARNTFALPNAMIEDELKTMIASYRDTARQNRLTVDEAALRQRLEGTARRRVALGLILSKIIENSRIVLDPNRVKQKVDDIAARFEDPEGVVRWYYADKNRLREVETLAMEEQIINLVLEKAKVVDQTVGFHELRQAAAAEAAPSAKSTESQAGERL